MGARWASLWIGLWMILAPVALNYHALTPILHDVALGLLVSALALAAFQWPLARIAVGLPALWLCLGARLTSAGDVRAYAAELTAGVILILLAAVPNGSSAVAAPASRAAKMSA